MGHNLVKKILAMMLAVAMCVTLIPGSVFATGNTSSEDNEVEEQASRTYSEDADSETGLSVKVGKSDITISVNRVGSSGTAEIYQFEADEYYSADEMSGLSSSVNASGEVIAKYECGTEKEITINRYQNDGTDNLYKKYYVVQDGKILAGPVYASEIYSLRTKEPFEQATKKGITLEDSSTINIAEEMGVSNTVINMDLCSLIVANEDSDGNPIDNSKKSGLIAYESNGETFYFNEDYVKSQDGLISAYSKQGINVTLVIIAWAKTWTSSYPSSLLYLAASENRQTMAFNTSTERGREYWIAAMEFMANRYSKTSTIGLVDKYVIGNEIDYTYDWSLMQPNKDSKGKYQRLEFNKFMEEFARTFRLANMAVKKNNSAAKVVISLTHNWAVNCYESYNASGNSIRINSYAPKDILDWMGTYEKARGDYDWGIAVHPYPIGTTSSKPTVTDVSFTGKNGTAYPITGDWETSPWITAANLELYQLYMEQPENMYNGELRTVSITETSICSLDEDANTAAAYKQSTYEQAASIAQYYYRAANIECIDAIAYFQPHDQSTYKLGLMQESGKEKPAYNVWKYIDTDKSFSYANKYLKYIDEDAESYKDVMPVVKSDFDWDAMWDEDNIIIRNIESESVERSVKTDKDSYGADEAISVTATGEIGDTVGLYYADDDVNKVEAIYSYPVQGTQNSLTFKSGRAYDVVTYGEASLVRAEDAKLKAGDYKIVLKYGDSDEAISVEIKITEDYSFGSETHSLKTNKDVYAGGEDIIVTATGNTNCWVGLYGKNDKYGSGGVTSIYWYYINDENAGQISGKPTIIQSTIHNTNSSNPSERVAAGEYILYLFDGSGGNDYNVVASKEITVETSTVESLTSIEYKLSDETDGFANGVVTITKDSDNDSATDCVMYWADENGEPLEGYTSLAKFKLKGSKTTHQMYTHTIIPEGAKKLIAYASDGDSLSEEAVETDLPEGCTYKITDDELAEFQIISDIHVTTDAGATGDVKLSNQHFTQMLEDVKANSKDSIGIFINGDIANTGSEAEYLKVYDLYQKSANAGNGTLPQLLISIGNHDWMAGNPNSQFQKYAKIYNNTLKKQPENVYYDEEVGGYHFIYLGGEQAGLRAYLSSEQLEWFDNRMAEISAEDPDEPVFVMLHQPLYNTVAGSLTGQGWDGVSNENSLKKIFAKYGQIILLGGHSHWELNSESCMYAGDESMAVAFNTAAVGYLWSSYDITGGEFAKGSHGYYVKVYEDKVVFMGREFESGEYIPSAIFVVQKNNIETSADKYTISLDKGSLDLEAKADDGGTLEYASSDSSIASVTADGTVIPKKTGEVTITITSSGSDTTVLSRKNVKVTIGNAAVYRIYGDTRYETSYKIADELKEQKEIEKFDTIIVASGTGFADALAGSYLAYKKDAPILMASSKNAESLRTYISENLKKGGTVYVLGGTAAVSDSIISGMTGCTIKRIGGANRYETNLNILKEAGVKDEDMIVCTGTDFADSLSASAAKKPILLVNKTLSDAQKEYLAALSGDQYYIIGGEKAVSKTMETELKEYGQVERIGGADRYETSVKVAETFVDDPEVAVLAYAKNFPDGLCGGPLAMVLNAPLILTANGKEDVAVEYTEDKGIGHGFVLGGSILISNNTTKNVFHLDSLTSIIEE